MYLGSSSRKVPIYRVSTDAKQVAISFDCAWGADKTEEILEILDEYNATATFFMVGFWVDKYPDMVKKIDEQGIEIGTHSNTHPDMAKLSKESIRQELTSSKEKIEAITNKTVSLFRAPFGSYNNTLLSVCEEENLTAIQWDVDSLDWKGLTATQVTERVMKYTKNGSIILMHNNADNVCASLRLSLDYLTKKGYSITSVGELIYKNGYVDSNGIQYEK